MNSFFQDSANSMTLKQRDNHLDSIAECALKPKWLSPQQAALYLGCSKVFLDKDRCTKLHGIPFSRLGRHIRYSIDDLDHWLEAHKIGGNTNED